MQLKLVTGGAVDGNLGTFNLAKAGQVQEGDVISFGVKTAADILWRSMLSVYNTTSLTIGLYCRIKWCSNRRNHITGITKPSILLH